MATPTPKPACPVVHNNNDPSVHNNPSVHNDLSAACGCGPGQQPQPSSGPTSLSKEDANLLLAGCGPKVPEQVAALQAAREAAQQQTRHW